MCWIHMFLKYFLHIPGIQQIQGTLILFIIRNFGFNLLEFVSKIGSSISPFIVDLGGVMDPGIPPLVFGCVLLVTSVSFLLLPETRGKQLPQTITQVEEDQEVTIARKYL